MWVVETLDKVEEGATGLSWRWEAVAIQQLTLQRGKEALTQGIVISKNAGRVKPKNKDTSPFHPKGSIEHQRSEKKALGSGLMHRRFHHLKGLSQTSLQSFQTMMPRSNSSLREEWVA